jgi:hypothetical protein
MINIWKMNFENILENELIIPWIRAQVGHLISSRVKFKSIT